MNLSNIKPASGSTHNSKRLGRGELKSSISIAAHKFTKSAEEAINKVGGKAITL